MIKTCDISFGVNVWHLFESISFFMNANFFRVALIKSMHVNYSIFLSYEIQIMISIGSFRQATSMIKT